MNPLSDRRDFLRAGLLATAAGGLAQGAGAEPAPAMNRSFALDGNRVRLTCPQIERAFTVLMVADTHLFRDDERGEPFRQFSGRMAKAYNQTKHFRTGEPTNPESGFKEALKAAAAANATQLALVGDIVSFPSEAAVEWVMAQLKSAGLPWLYTAGNHDWHYEGMAGPLADLRAEWISLRLAPLYRGADPMMSVLELNGVRFVTLDNSTYEISPAQLAFFREQAATGRPMVLFVHIPLYAPGRPLGFGCGHPEWGAKSDRGFELERRVKWREGGHTGTTMDFHREVFASPNLLGIFAGHTHRASVDVVGGVVQCVTDANATGAFLQLDFTPS